MAESSNGDQEAQGPQPVLVNSSINTRRFCWAMAMSDTTMSMIPEMKALFIIS
jgi:hypothetical protein